MIDVPATTRLGSSLDLRLHSDDISLGENIVFDDGVRIVVPPSGKLVIGDNVKIGKGTVLNCGGTIIIESDVSFYGYCYLQSSRWVWNGEVKDYTYHRLTIGKGAVLAPNTTVAGDVVVPGGYRSQPGEVLGEW